MSHLALSRAFASAWPGQLDDADAAELGRSLAAILATARATWPRLALDDDEFTRFLAERTPAEGLRAAVQRFQTRAADLFLACACARDVPGAIAAFDEAHLAGCGAHLGRVDASPAFVEEVAQTVREKLFVGAPGQRPRITEYDGRGALAGWVRVTLVRTALNLRRARTVVLASNERELDAAVARDAALDYAKASYRVPFELAVRAAVSELSPRQRTVLRFHYVDGLGIDKIARLYEVHRSTAARWLADTREALQSSIRSELRRQLGVVGSECESLVAALYSQVTLSLGSLL